MKAVSLSALVPPHSTSTISNISLQYVDTHCVGRMAEIELWKLLYKGKIADLLPLSREELASKSI